MNRFLAALLLAVLCIASSACSKQQPATSSQPPASQPSQSQPANAPSAAQADASATPEDSAAAAPTETVSETEDAPQATDQQTPSGVQPTLRLGAPLPTLPASEHLKEGTTYRRVVPAQPTSVAPGKVEVVEVFWYGCSHCFELDRAIESWRKKGKPAYVEFTRVPGMWNDTLRMHARLYYATEALGKLEELHSAIFREIHENKNPLTTVEQMKAFFKQHGVNPEEFQKAFSSFGVESKLQRADFLNRRFGINQVPTFVVNGKYVTDAGMAGGERELFDVIDELAAHEHGG